jgi:hypothetical protein
MRAVRRLGALLLLLAAGGVLGFAGYYGFVHAPADGGRSVQAVYSCVLLLPPALFLVLALGLLLRNAAGVSVLGTVGVAVLVGAPTIVLFLGGEVGISLSALTLVLLGAASLALARRRETA